MQSAEEQIKGTVGVWIAHGVLTGIGDVYSLLSILTPSLCIEQRIKKQELHPILCEKITDLCWHLNKEDLPYDRAPGHYLWVAAQRVNLLCHFFTFEEQNNVLWQLEMQKFPDFSVDKLQKITYN